jgi:hypothetical protein
LSIYYVYTILFIPELPGLLACHCLRATASQVSDFIVQAKANTRPRPHVFPQHRPHRFVAVPAAQQLQQAIPAPETLVLGRVAALAVHTPQPVVYVAQPLQQQQQVLPVSNVGGQPQQLLLAAGGSPVTWGGRIASADTGVLLQPQQLAAGSSNSSQASLLLAAPPASGMMLPLVSAPETLAVTASNASCMPAASMLSSSNSLPSSYVLRSTSSGLSEALVEASSALTVANTCSPDVLTLQRQQQQQQVQQHMQQYHLVSAGEMVQPALQPGQPIQAAQISGAPAAAAFGNTGLLLGPQLPLASNTQTLQLALQPTTAASLSAAASAHSTAGLQAWPQPLVMAGAASSEGLLVESPQIPRLLVQVDLQNWQVAVQQPQVAVHNSPVTVVSGPGAPGLPLADSNAGTFFCSPIVL